MQGCLNAFQHLSPGTSYALLLALWPLSHHQPDIQPAVVSLLRRAMFSRDLSMRLTAVRGFIYVILQVTVLPCPVTHSSPALEQTSKHTVQLCSQLDTLQFIPDMSKRDCKTATIMP